MTGVNRASFPSARIAFLLVAAAAVLRFATLGHQSLWLDEAFCVWVATQHTAHTIWTTRLDPNHPSLFFLILHWFLNLTGVSEATARMPSAIGSVANLGLLYALGRVLFPRTAVGRMAAVLLALAPIDLWYAQEARMYSLVATTGVVLALGLFIERWWAVALIVGGLAGGLAIDHTMWPVAMLLLSVWTIHWFHRGRRWPDLLRVGVGATTAWFLYRPVWVEAADVFDRLSTVSFFANVRRFVGLQNVSTVQLPAALLLFYLLCLVTLGALWATFRHPSRRRWLEYATWSLFVAATVLVAVPRMYGLKQILVAVWPLFVLVATWAAIAIDQRSPSRPGRAGVSGHAFLIATAVSLCALLFTFSTPRADWRGVAARLESSTSPRTVVVLDPSWNRLPYDYYRPGHPVVSGPVDSRAALVATNRDADQACLIAQRFGPRPPTSPTEAWLDRSFELLSTTTFARLELRCYRIPAAK